MVQYPSWYICYEDEPKNSLKSTSVKLFVFALVAQTGVDAERIVLWETYNGI